MTKLTLIYFEGCPNASTVRRNLTESGLKFEEVRQDKLAASDPMKNYSSPTILRGSEILFGTKTGSEGGCSLKIPTSQEIQAAVRSEVTATKALAPTGSLGSIITVLLCPLCKPAIAVFLSTIGLGFLVREAVLKPLLVGFLAITTAGLAWSYFRVHRNVWPLTVGVVMCIGLYLGRYVYFGDLENESLTYVSIGGLLVVSIWNTKIKPSVACAGKCSSTKTMEV